MIVVIKHNNVTLTNYKCTESTNYICDLLNPKQIAIYTIYVCGDDDLYYLVFALSLTQNERKWQGQKGRISIILTFCIWISHFSFPFERLVSYFFVSLQTRLKIPNTMNEQTETLVPCTRTIDSCNYTHFIFIGFYFWWFA